MDKTDYGGQYYIPPKELLILILNRNWEQATLYMMPKAFLFYRCFLVVI